MKVQESVVARVVNAVRADIRLNLGAGQKLEPLRVLAGRYEVSQMTMWQALGLLVHEGTLRVRHGAGYYVMERPVKKHVGILLELDLSLPTCSRFWPAVVLNIRRGLREQGFRARFYAGNQVPDEAGTVGIPCEDLCEDIEDDLLSGLVVVWGSTAPGRMELLQRRKVPIVGNGNWYPFSVWLDYPGLVAEATRRLLSEGCRKIAFMEWGPPGSDARQGSALFHAFTRELALHGATLNPHWVRSDLHPASEGAGWAEFREIWAAESVKPDGLIVADDMLCLGAVEAIRELGIRVPAQLRVVSHGNKGSGVRYPFPVSVLECDPAEYAQAMVKLMVAQLRQEPVECPQVLLPFKWAEQDVETAASPGENIGNGIQVGRIVPMSRVNEGAQ